ncbi:hypothetical protein FA95DRAFT_1220455 [Auriscalpium vulgare]|uniref:Uncharacterized protein n=1 Tax=Auriscalpium vulgare TaxID=40419 RepID=A0ACB8RTZ4_9AGAM|nr:hypothetical protein FA95DRAFT_1220455 [Auriscalpium vulgare]
MEGLKVRSLEVTMAGAAILNSDPNAGLAVYPPHEFDNILGLLNELPAPYLESLALDWRRDLPESIFAFTIPARLTRLVLIGACSTPRASVFHAPLTYLELRSCRIWETYDQLFDSLSALPGLQILVLDGAEPSDVSCPMRDVNSVDLPHLRVLELQDSWRGTEYILKTLRVPNDIQLTLTLPLDGTSGPTQWSRMAHVLRSIVPHETLRFKKVVIDPYVDYSGTESAGFTFTASSSRLLQASGMESSLPPQLRLKFPWAEADEDRQRDEAWLIARVLQAFFSGPNKAGLIMRVAHPAFRSVEGWRGLPGVLKGAQRLHVCSDAASGFIALLQKLPFLFKELRALCIEGADFSGFLSDREGITLFTGLVQLLQVNQGEFALDQLVIVNCAVGSEAVDALRRMVGSNKVHWDVGDGEHVEDLISQLGEWMI